MDQGDPGVVPSDDFPPQRKRLDQLKALIPHMAIAQFGPGHRFLAEERPERVAELVSEWIANIRKGDMTWLRQTTCKIWPDGCALGFRKES